MKIKIYNTLSKKIDDFEPIDKNEVRLYSCGPTVYNFAHIGNLRAFLFADLLQNVLREVGDYKVKWVMNITDIDDKTIKSIQKDSGKWLSEMGEQSGNAYIDIRSFTSYYLKKFLEDINAIGIEKKDFYSMPRATDFIEEMSELVKMIFNNGFAYIADGNVYFNVTKWREGKEYGRLKNIDFDNFKEGVRIDSDEYEREQVSDFVLWKKKKDGEPSWKLEIGDQILEGRPGWHLECSAMEKEILGLPFDIHTGGVDLQFPHHEDEIAQSHSGYGVDPTNFWCHNEFLEVEGKKMSKKLGNFFTLRDLQDKGYDPLDIRFLILNQHYRTKFNFTLKGIEDAKISRTKIQNYIFELIEKKDELTGNLQATEIEEFKSKVLRLLAEDLHTPKAIAEVFSFIGNHKVENFSKEAAKILLNFISKLNNIYKVWTFDKKLNIIDIPENIIDIAEKRFQAKKDKNWDKADNLRNKLSEMGWIVKDAKDSYEILKK